MQRCMLVSSNRMALLLHGLCRTLMRSATSNGCTVGRKRISKTYLNLNLASGWPPGRVRH
jgi:hypothetical protein